MKRGPLSCGGTVIIHEDRAVTCTEIDCYFIGIAQKMTTCHVSFAPCREVFDSCPRCSPAPPEIQPGSIDAI